MDALTLPVSLCLGGIGLILALGAGALVLLKLGVFAKYAVKDEPEDHGEYGLDQSQEADQE